MKRFTQLLTALVFCSLVIFISCKKKNGGGEDPDERDEVAAAIASNVWVPTSVEFDDANRTEWDGFSISFSYNNDSDVGSYTVSGVPTDDGASDVWGENPSWTFAGTEEAPNTGTIVRTHDGIEMSAQLDNPDAPTVLTLTFSVEDPGAKTAGFYGTWEFVLEPQ